MWMDSYALLLLLLATMAMAAIGWRMIKKGESQKRLSDKRKM